jgi:membrane protease subunit HflC
MKNSHIVLGVVALFALLVLMDGVFIVDETKQVIITQFGRPVRDEITDPGVYFKLPFIQKARFFEKRFLEWDGDVNQVPTKDKRFIWVDTYARWRISDPLLFYQRLTDESGGQLRLDDIIDGATRDSVANHDLMELVRSSNRDIMVDPNLPEGEVITDLPDIETGRNEIMEEIRTTAAARSADLGIEVIDVRFKRIDYNDDVRQNVYERMIAERQRIAQRYRSEGLGESARIRGDKEKDLKEITSEAYRQAQELIGKADGEATAIYADAYNRDPDFFQFLKTMESYDKAFDEESWLILSTEGDFFKYIQQARPR